METLLQLHPTVLVIGGVFLGFILCTLLAILFAHKTIQENRVMRSFIHSIYKSANKHKNVCPRTLEATRKILF